jgi:regulator of protease activity HflC (stomatin/prohibitin superfamily)
MGTAIRTYLWPGSIYVLVPSTKNEAKFEITQESKDGIPLRFKGIVIYRITDPVAATQMFPFYRRSNIRVGIDEISMLISHICMGELRSVVAHMTMQECIEQRKSTLTKAIETALKLVIEGLTNNDIEGQLTKKWGIDIEVLQVAQVFIVDEELRKQLEADVRNEIKSKSEQSEILAGEETELARLSSAQRVEQEKLDSEKLNIQISEEIELSKNASKRRLMQENLETTRKEIELSLDKFRLEQEAEKEEIEIQSPVQLLKIKKQQEIQKDDLKRVRVLKEIKEIDAETKILLEKAKQNMKKDIMPIEQLPEISDAFSRMFQGMNISVYGDESEFLNKMIPVVDILLNAIQGLNQ